MTKSDSNQISKIKPFRVILPSVIGLLVIGYFINRDFHKIDFSVFELTNFTIIFLLLAILFMLCRDLGYVVRLRVLSDSKLSWIKCVRIVFLWEFGSAITPSAIGGTALATIFIWKEGLQVGKSTSIVVATSFLDELYFSIVFPLIFLFFSNSQLFDIEGSSSFTDRFLLFALIGYSMKLAWTILMGYSIFINHRFFASLIKGVFKLRFLKRWKPAAEALSQDFELSNKEFKKKNIWFWLKGASATFLSWTSRFLVLNFLLLALVHSIGVRTADNLMSISDHFLIFAKQLVMWIMMLVMPTPGGSGFVETVFNSYMVEFVPIAGFVVIVAMIWRMVTYYPYLLIGSIISPRWVNRNFKKRKKHD